MRVNKWNTEHQDTWEWNSRKRFSHGYWVAILKQHPSLTYGKKKISQASAPKVKRPAAYSVLVTRKRWLRKRATQRQQRLGSLIYEERLKELNKSGLAKQWLNHNMKSSHCQQYLKCLSEGHWLFGWVHFEWTEVLKQKQEKWKPDLSWRWSVLGLTATAISSLNAGSGRPESSPALSRHFL